MPSIHGGGGFIPQQIQNQQVRQAPPAQVQQQQAQAAPKDTVRLQATPTQTSLTSQVAQRLTSDATRVSIHNLIQQQQVQLPAEKPQLQMMQKPAMGSALAEMLSQHHVAEAAPQQQAANPQAPNAQAQLAAGMLQSAANQKIHDHTEDSSRRSTLQSGKRVRKEEQEGEFSSLMDMSDEGGMFGQSGQDGRSDSQKKKQLLEAQKKKLPPAPKGQLEKPRLKTTGQQAGAPNSTTKSPLNTQPKPPAVKPVVNKVQPLQKPKPKADEWDF